MKTIAELPYFFKMVLLWGSPLLLFACEDPIEIALDEGQVLLVVDGWVTDQPGPHQVILSKTSPYFNNMPAPRVKGAEVSITDSDGNLEILTENQPGQYMTSASFRGKAGSQYFLHIRSEGQEYKAQTEIRRKPVIDSLNQVFREKSLITEEGYYLLYNGPEKAGPGDFYHFKLFKNDSLLNKPENLLVMQDKLIDGSYFKDFELNNVPFQLEDHIRVETWSITEDAYFYYMEMLRQLRNGGFFADPIANIRTNIESVRPENKGKAIGYFGGASVAVKELTIQ